MAARIDPMAFAIGPPVAVRDHRHEDIHAAVINPIAVSAEAGIEQRNVDRYIGRFCRSDKAKARNLRCGSDESDCCQSSGARQ